MYPDTSKFWSDVTDRTCRPSDLFGTNIKGVTCVPPHSERSWCKLKIGIHQNSSFPYLLLPSKLTSHNWGKWETKQAIAMFSLRINSVNSSSVDIATSTSPWNPNPDHRFKIVQGIVHLYRNLTPSPAATSYATAASSSSSSASTAIPSNDSLLPVMTYCH